jgi:cytochrome c biogenesis protein CcmG/thiol:disulfide interchange protein DsbE
VTRRLTVLLVAVAVVGGLAAILGSGLGRASSQLVDQSSASPLIGHRAPPLSGRTLQGHHFSLAGDFARLTFVNVWASWCGPCRQELPLIADIAARWTASGTGARVVTIDTKDGTVPARNMLRRSGATGLPTLSDPHGDRAVAWGATGVPETFVVDGHGIVRARHVGPVTRDWLEQQAIRWGAQ